MPDIKALIAAADTVSVQFVKDFPDATFRLIAEMRDALEAAQQAPAVDRQALISSPANAECWEKDDVGGWAFVPELGADRLFASGILQDAAALSREVEARGLERLIERVTDDEVVQIFGGEKFVSVALLVSEARAQQVREGN